MCSKIRQYAVYIVKCVVNIVKRVVHLVKCVENIVSEDRVDPGQLLGQVQSQADPLW